MLTHTSRHRRRNGRPRSLGFTLVEMLIAMVLTLIMVYAIAEFYAYVGETVKDGRALIEIRSSMRTALQRLKDDLDHLTVKVTPPVDDAAAQGYFCLTEGICNDASPLPGALGATDSDGTGGPDIGQDTNGDGYADYLEGAINATNLLGDTDDVLAFTIRNDVDPFAAPSATLINPADGIWTGTSAMQSSSVAEVTWFTGFTDNPTFPTAGGWDAGEAKSLHRRLLLVRPDVNLIHSGDTDYVDGSGQPAGPYYVRVPGTNVAQAYYQLMQASDVSVRPLVVNNTYVTVGGHVYFVANSLADLTRRENRFMNAAPGLATGFPNALDLNPHFAGTLAANPWDAANNASLYRWLLNDEPVFNSHRRGEDVMLSNILAFDVRVFDITAVLRADPVGAVAVQPGDPGYELATSTGYSLLGTGAYVDLNYTRSYPAPVASGVSSTFSGAAQARSGLMATYDTWAASYERDGLNQDYAADGATNITTGPFDEGTNGLDDADPVSGVAANGVDDAGERETLPPYPVPLRGIEIKLRVYEPGTRQAQQATVGADFVAE